MGNREKCYKLYGNIRGIQPVKGFDMRRGVEFYNLGYTTYFTLKQAEKILIDLQKAINHAKGGVL